MSGNETLEYHFCSSFSRCSIFAGCDIDSANELDVRKLREKCIPHTLNKGLSLGQLYKRLKLSFSTTAESMVRDSHICLEDYDLSINSQGQ
jgi:hypothetical protein